MKIAWFSPLPPARSDVANFTRRLEPELRRRFDVQFLTEKMDGFAEPAANRSYPVELGHVSPGLLRALNRVDVPIYNLGNHAEFFAQTWFLSQTKPGVVVLHDLKLHHFFDGVYRQRFGDQRRYLALMEKHYGTPGLEAGRMYWREKVSVDFMAKQFPMLAWGVQNALAVVVHTPFAQETVERQTGLPTWLNALPYQAHAAGGGGVASKPDCFSPERPARVVIFGHLNRNRRVTEFLHALARMPEPACFEVQIYGETPVTYLGEVRAMIARLNLQARVTLHGFVTEETLDAGLARSDIAINLRYPTMGESSGSLLRIWDHALPALVTQIDAYASLPVETLRFVRPEHEAEDIQRHLRDFLACPEEFRRMGACGREHLLRTHRPDAYAERLLTLCERVAELRSRHVRLRMGSRVGASLATWQSTAKGADRAMQYAERIAETF